MQLGIVLYSTAGGAHKCTIQQYKLFLNQERGQGQREWNAQVKSATN